GRDGGERAASGEDDKTDEDDGVASQPVRPAPEGQLQQALGKAVDAERKPGGQWRGAGHLADMQCQHRQHHEQAEHAQPEQARKRDNRLPVGVTRGADLTRGTALRLSHKAAYSSRFRPIPSETPLEWKTSPSAARARTTCATSISTCHATRSS